MDRTIAEAVLGKNVIEEVLEIMVQNVKQKEETIKVFRKTGSFDAVITALYVQKKTKINMKEIVNQLD